jgi:hypothetical protein
MIGVLSSLTGPLTDAGISVFVLSTYDTDLILVREEAVAAACKTLMDAGHIIDPP